MKWLHKWFLAAFILVGSVPVLSASDRSNLGFAYSYLRLPGSGSAAVANSTGRNRSGQGFQIDYTEKLSKWFGIAFELGLNTGCVTPDGRCVGPLSGKTSRSILTYMAGPIVYLRKEPPAVPWIHSLIGGASFAEGGSCSQYDYKDCDPGRTGFSMAVGGGLDIPLKKLTVRAFQIDYVRNKALPQGNAIRLSVGIAIPVQGLGLGKHE